MTKQQRLKRYIHTHIISAANWELANDYKGYAKSPRGLIQKKFESEYSETMRMQGWSKEKASLEWLQGLSLPIAFETYKINQMFTLFGLPEKDSNDDTYWNIAAKFVAKIIA